MADSIKRVGLTGGIGSGKSTVARMLRQQGAVVVDADAIARELMTPGSPVLDDVAEAFGPDVLDASGALDRAGLARIVFGDDEARERLNGIVHPAVRAESQRLVDEAASAPDFAGVIVQDIPLLVETGQGGDFDAVIVVEAPEDLRVERLVSSRGMAEEDARARIRAQATDDQRRAVATRIIDNSGEPEATAAQVETIWSDLTEE